MNTNTLIRKTKAELINIINSQNEEIANLSAKIDSLTANKIKDNSLRERINSLAKKYQEKEIELDKLKKDYEDTLDKHSRELQKTILKYNAEIREKDEKYNALMGIRNVISKENEELKSKQTDYENKIESLYNNINKLVDENQDLSIENEDKAQLINAMDLTIQNKELETKILKKDLNNKKSSLKINSIIYIICMIIITLLGIFVF